MILAMEVYVVDLEEMKREIEALVVAKGFYNGRHDVLKKQASSMCATSTTTRYSENANAKCQHRPDKPPGNFNIIVRGVGFEPTEAYARGS